jgi:hypothetical protein
MRGEALAQLNVLTSMSNIQESLLGAGQQVYIGALERIEQLAHEIATLGGDRTHWSGLTERAQHLVAPPRPPR